MGQDKVCLTHSCLVLMGLAGASIVVIIRNTSFIIPIVLNVNLVLFVYEADIDNDPHKKQ